jgi:hypothetical protein
VLTVRPGRPDDAAAITRVHAMAWRWAYRDLVPQSYLDTLDPDDPEKRWPAGGST